jgi:hypothetical protein
VRGQVEASAGCTAADPFVDDELVQKVASFPLESLICQDSSRGLFRLALRGSVPEKLRLRRDKGTFEAALFDMIGPAELRALRDLSGMQYSADLGLVEPGPFRQCFEEMWDEGRSGSRWLQIWPALAVEAFARRIDGSATQDLGKWRMTA